LVSSNGSVQKNAKILNYLQLIHIMKEASIYTLSDQIFLGHIRFSKATSFSFHQTQTPIIF